MSFSNASKQANNCLNKKEIRLQIEGALPLDTITVDLSEYSDNVYNKEL